MVSSLEDVKFTQQLKNEWMERYKSVEHCSVVFRKGNCFCAYGALADVLADKGLWNWSSNEGNFTRILEIPYFRYLDTKIFEEIWSVNDELLEKKNCNKDQREKIICELINKLPVED